MNPMKAMIEQRLIANVIMDKCAKSEYVIFCDAWCSQDKIIRFTTKFGQSKYPKKKFFYEAENTKDSFVVKCVCDDQVLHTWDITSVNPNDVFVAFDELIEHRIPLFEDMLKQEIQEEFTEGKKKAVYITKYERNPKARAACLEYHGFTCKICGMNFEEHYGPEYKNIIEVHHLVPLSQIGKEYVVDPIHDLIPVCPNCHTALHSKDGVNFYKKYKEKK